LVKYLTNELKRLGYNPYVDEHNNILVTKPASAGLEKAPIVLLQAHSDMVGSKDPSSKHDFLKDPIKTIVEKD
jgi:dipeptidase D